MIAFFLFWSDMLLSKQKGGKGATYVKELVEEGNAVLKVTKKNSSNAYSS